MTITTVAKAHNPQAVRTKEVKLTDGGRTMYGGGGITPDEKIAELKSNHAQDVLLQHYAFFQLFQALPRQPYRHQRPNGERCSASGFQNLPAVREDRCIR